MKNKLLKLETYIDTHRKVGVIGLIVAGIFGWFLGNWIVAAIILGLIIANTIYLLAKRRA